MNIKATFLGFAVVTAATGASAGTALGTQLGGVLGTTLGTVLGAVLGTSLGIDPVVGSSALLLAAGAALVAGVRIVRREQGR